MEAKNVQKKLLEYMDGMDLSELTMEELRIYADTMVKAAELDRKDYVESLMEVMKNAGAFGSGYSCPPGSVVGT